MTEDVRSPQNLKVVTQISLKLNISKTVLNGWIATKLAHDGPQYSPHPWSTQGQGQGRRSRDTDTFCDFTKIASSRRQMAGSPLNLHMMVPSVARIQGVFKVKVRVKGHVMGTVCDFTKIASSRRQMAGSLPNLHMMVHRRARIQDVLKVKSHVIGSSVC